MNIIDAVKAMKKGNRVKRPKYIGCIFINPVYMSLKPILQKSVFYFNFEGIISWEYSLTVDDILAEDWEIVEINIKVEGVKG
jgi:hypothetical protein